MATKFFGQHLLEKGLINKDQFLATLEKQREGNPRLGDLATKMGFLTPAQSHKINDKQKSTDAKFGDIAVSMQLLTTAQLQELIDLQNGSRKLFGKVLSELGYLSPEEVETEFSHYHLEQKQLSNVIRVTVANNSNAQSINACAEIVSKLFTRLFHIPAQFSALAEGHEFAEKSDKLNYLSSITIESVEDITLTIACEQSMMFDIACHLIKIGKDEIDEELAWDATGEFLNIVTGYYAKDTIPQDCSYRAKPPVFSQGLRSLPEMFESVCGLKMDSEIGEFFVCISR
jgi:CheY-specific phosphatase CheX